VRLDRRQVLRLVVATPALSIGTRLVLAQAYPSRPVHILVGYAAGGPTDIAARLIAQWLSERLGKQFVVENRPGGGSNLATETVARAAPDGYTLLLVGASAALNASLYDNLSFNFIRDIVPIAGMFWAPLVMVVGPSFRGHTVPEFLAYAKANPGKLNMASGGNGSPAHVSGELFKIMAGLDMIHVPYRGEAAALPDLLAGQVQVMFPAASAVVEHVKEGRLSALAVTTATRSPFLPQVPALGSTFRATRRALGMASARPATPLSKSSASSTSRSTQP
jgi:tripartite-type tricarboxylate transporter receptor subunit TctC